MLRTRLIAVCAAGLSLVLLAAGCAVVADGAVDILMQIGEAVVVDEGAQYVEKILHLDDANGAPTLMVTYTNAAGDGVGEAYAIEKANEINISQVSGDIHLVGDGHRLAVTVSAGTTATIRIGSGGGNVASDPKNVAIAIDGILSWSGQSRSALGSALNDVGDCRNLSSAAVALQSVADARAHQLDALHDLDVAALNDGESLRDTLVTALNYSLEADQAYVRWGEHVRANGCGTDDADHDQGDAYSVNATNTKKQFVVSWNPVARMYGLRPRSEPQV